MDKKIFDLEERTLKFTKDVIDLCKTIKTNTINIVLINQIVRSAGSIGANYREANDAFSKKDFYHRINICKKESKETKYWLEIMMHANNDHTREINPLIEECTQLIKIFVKIGKSNN